MGSPSPANPVTQTTQISQMDPRLYQWMYGTPNSPGRQQIANSAMLAKTMQGVQNADPTALAAYYNVPKGTDLNQFQSHIGAMNPGQADPGLANLPGTAVTPEDYYKEATAKDKKSNKNPTSTAIATAKEGGELDAYARGGRPKKPKEPAKPAGYTGKVPLSKETADVGVTPFFDPSTMQSTNPYYNQAIGVLNQMGTMPSQYQQASNVYNQAAQGLLGQTNYQPQQVSAQDITAAQMAAAQMNRGDVRDIAAQQAQVERMQGGPNVNAVDAERAAMMGPETWTQPGVSQKYMSPYMQNVVDVQKREANRDFQKQMAQLNAQAVGQGAYGGSRQAIERSEARRNQAQRLGDIQATGLQQAYGQGMGQFQNESQLTQAARQSNLGAAMQANLANQQAGMTAQQLNQMYGQGGFQAQAANQSAQNQAYNNYVAQMLAAQQSNQGMDWNVGNLNTSNQQQANLTNAQLQQQAAMANQQAALQAGLANQQAGLSAQGLNLQAYNQAGNMGQGLLGVGQGMGAYNQNLLQNWGAAGNTLQNLAQGYYDKRQQSAQNIWGGVNQAVQPAAGTLLGSPWGSSYQGQYQQRKEGGKLRIKV